MKNNLILIGFMGAGKTSVGQAYAKARNKAFVDTDQLIEETAGKSIREIFADEGEEAFRRMESEMLSRLLEETDGAVVSTGGGLVLREENRSMLKKLGAVVYLRVRPDTVLLRLSGDATRPLLAGEDAREKVEKLLTDRSPVYEAAAHVTVDVDEKTVDEITCEINRLFKEG